MQELRLEELRFELPAVEDAERFYGMMQEWKSEGARIHPALLRLYEGDYARWLSIVRRYRSGNLREADVSQTLYFVKCGDDVVGAVSLRSELIPKVINGHISYGIRPSFRRRGCGRQVFLMALRLLEREHGIHAAIVTCDPSNAASRRIIESCGGLLLRQGYKKQRLLNVYSMRFDTSI